MSEIDWSCVRVRLRAEERHVRYDDLAFEPGVLPGVLGLLMVERGPNLFSMPAASWAALAPAERRTRFQAAIDRTVATTTVMRSETQLPDGAGYSVFAGDDHTTSTLALRAERLVSADPRWGALVAAPRSQLALAHAIADHRMIPMISRMAFVAAGIFSEGPAPLVSPRLFWVRGAHCEALDVEVDLAARRVTRFSPSAQFATEVLMPLGGDTLRSV